MEHSLTAEEEEEVSGRVEGPVGSISQSSAQVVSGSATDGQVERELQDSSMWSGIHLVDVL